VKSHHTAREQDSARVRAVVALVFVCFVIACTAALPARASDKKEKEKAGTQGVGLVVGRPLSSLPLALIAAGPQSRPRRDHVQAC